MSETNENLGEIRVRIKLAVLLSLISIILIACYVAYKDWRDQLTFAAAVIGGAAAVYTGYYTAATIRENIAESRARTAQAKADEARTIANSREKAHRARVAASFEFLRHANDLGYNKIRTKLLNTISFDGKASAAEIHDKILKNDELREVVFANLGFFEDMAIAIKAEHVDERVLYYAICGTVFSMHTNLGLFIKHEQDDRGENFYAEFESLANAWRGYKSVVTGAAFPQGLYSKPAEVLHTP